MNNPKHQVIAYAIDADGYVRWAKEKDYDNGFEAIKCFNRWVKWYSENSATRTTTIKRHNRGAEVALKVIKNEFGF